MSLIELLLAWAVGKMLDAVAPSITSATPDRSPAPRRPDRSRRPTVRASTPVPTTSTPPWPMVVPRGLPPFPGPGWVPDEPPPGPVVARAHALLPVLWAHGEGTFKVEQTAGRFIVYRATDMDGKKGVVAFRQAARAPSAPADDVDVDIGPATDVGPVITASVPAAPAAAPASPSTGLSTLRRGSRGDDVKILQQTLGITADGIFGPGTENAVRAFQRSRGLSADGVVGPQTWGALLGTGRRA